MEQWYEQLLAEVRAQDEALRISQDTDLQARLCLSAVADIVDELHTLLQQHSFSREEEEIIFFKEIKPEFDGRFLFYMDLVVMLMAAPKKDSKAKEQYYREKLAHVGGFLQKESSYVLYRSLGHRHFDHAYYLRATGFLPDPSVSFLPLLDNQRYAPQSYLAARVTAEQLMKDFIEEQLHPGSGAPGVPFEPIKWTGNKQELAEVLYALNEMGVFNGKKEPIALLANFFGRIFKIDLSNIYKMYENNRLKKKARTPFLDAVKLALLRRYEYDDEHVG